MINSKIIGSIIKGFEHFYIAEHFKNNNNKSILYVARDDREIFQIKEKLHWLLPKANILLYRSWDQIPYDKVSPIKEIQSERIKTLYSINIKEHIFIVLTSANAILQKTLDKKFLKEYFIEIYQGKKIFFDKLIHQLISLGYERTTIVREKGEFAVRGSIIDINLINIINPIRIDFFDNIIESINEFDSLTQKKISKFICEKIIINPSSEILLNKKTINRFRSVFRENFSDHRKSEIYNSLSNGIMLPGGEQFISFFYDSLSSLFSYCQEYDIILNSSFNETIESRIENIYDYYYVRNETGDKFNVNPKSLYFSFSEILYYLNQSIVFKIQSFNIENGYNFDLKILPNLSSIKKKIDFNFINKFINTHISKKNLIICARSQGVLKRIKKILFDNLSLSIEEIRDYSEIINTKNEIYISVLKIEEAVQYADNIFINERSLFGYNFSSQHTPSKQKDIFFEEINKLSKNSILVHSDYGLCRFKDIKKIEINNSLHDCVELEFSNDQKLFLPVENLNFVTKYGDDEKKIIQLDKLGNSSWQFRKSKAKNRIKEIARELMKVAAKRFMSKSFPIIFDPITYDQISHSFPFIETEDQLKAIDDIKSDFSKKIPADRVIIADVAYGKSEIIIRSVFLAAKSKLQSILLVPTTLLARQHYNNFSQRLVPLGIKVRQLSRLISLKEKIETIKLLKEGSIDVLIGTHALLNKKISFNKLGLIVVDEEQHFGVKAKEQLKQLSPKAHVISLSATPIPRTMSLALSNIRDLSLILTAPHERLSIRTFLSPFDPLTIKEAIRREIIGRKGGVFYVTPRKKDIPFLEKFLKENLPEIQYIIAHGQLSAKTLEERISKFYDRKIPLILCTNIIESGLDLSHVNTIIIHRANMFSLAGIYQLKGRVGRSSKRGYAYLTYQEKELTENARKRLNIINSFSQLGSGFNIASQDLNIRGGGSIIGEEQSGHIKEVGVELYHQLLEEEILDQKNKQFNFKTPIKKNLFHPTIKIPEQIFIPDEYINDMDVKISIYKRISLVTTNEEKENMIIEIIDRFGKMPQEVKNLFELIEIKILCYKENIEKIDFGRKGILFSFFQDKPKNLNKIINLGLEYKKSKIKIRPDYKVFYPFQGILDNNRFQLIKDIIKLIS